MRNAARLPQVCPQLEQAVQAGAGRARRAGVGGRVPGRAARQRGRAVGGQRLAQLLPRRRGSGGSGCSVPQLTGPMRTQQHAFTTRHCSSKSRSDLVCLGANDCWVLHPQPVTKQGHRRQRTCDSCPQQSKPSGVCPLLRKGAVKSGRALRRMCPTAWARLHAQGGARDAVAALPQCAPPGGPPRAPARTHRAPGYYLAAPRVSRPAAPGCRAAAQAPAGLAPHG